MRIFSNNASNVFARYIILWTLFTFVLNILHATFLGINLTPLAFLMPAIAGIVFGVMNARVSLLSGHLSWLANHDSLTQAYNRAYFNEKMSTLDTWEDSQKPISLMVLDIDFFKKVNDTYGHHAGDEILVRVSKLINDAKRGWDIFARYGGEEFVILAPKTNLHGALEFAERIRQIVSEYTFPEVKTITVSIGVAEYQPGLETSQDLFKRADAALYEAKDNGRNQVVSAATTQAAALS